MLKHRHLEDYHRSIADLDEKEYLSIRFCFLDLRNSYAILNDMIHKNKAKLEKPRSSHSSAMIY